MDPLNYSVKLKCGCEIPIINGKIDIDYDNLNDNCQKTWRLYQDGHTRSIFQLESRLCQNWSKELKPTCMKDAADLIAIVRPGTLHAEDEDGRSMTKVFCERKNDKEDYDKDSPLSVLLKDTYSILVYQEQLMYISKKLAGFDGKQANKIMKSIGKKDATLLFSLEKEFVEGCVNANILDREQATAAFLNIKSSARYMFNKCALGSQKLRRPTSTGKFEPTIEEMYKITTDREYAVKTGHYQLWKKNRRLKCFGYSLSMGKDGRIKKNKIIDIKPAGIQQCFLIEVESGKTCEVTILHKFPTPSGEKRVCDLKVGDSIYICGEYEKENNKKYTWSNYDNESIRKLRKQIALTEKDGRVAHGNYQLFVKNKTILLEDKICEICKKDSKRIEIHHKDSNRFNNEIANLQKLCPSCHKKEEYKNGRVKHGEKGYPVLIEKIISIKPSQIGETYDITMEAPNHNFVFDSGIVTSNSHSYEYAMIGYQTAWVKAHFPEEYICGWLKIAKEEAKPLEEIRAMMSEARRLKIKVYGPSVRNLPKTDFFIDDDCVFFGLSSIKNCSEDAFTKINEEGINYKTITWIEFLILYSHLLSKRQLIPMIQVGCFDDLSLKPRLECEYEYNQWNTLTVAQKKKVREFYISLPKENLLELIKAFIIEAPKVEKYKLIAYSLENCPMDLSDSKKNLIEHEKELLGINITCSHIERASVPNTALTCKAINEDKSKDKYKVYDVVGEITEFGEFKVKNTKSKICGQMMATFKLNDNTDELDVVAFPDALDEFQSALYEGNVVLIKGKKSNRGSGLILSEIYEV